MYSVDAFRRHAILLASPWAKAHRTVGHRHFFSVHAADGVARPKKARTLRNRTGDVQHCRSRWGSAHEGDTLKPRPRRAAGCTLPALELHSCTVRTYGRCHMSIVHCTAREAIEAAVAADGAVCYADVPSAVLGVLSGGHWQVLLGDPHHGPSPGADVAADGFGVMAIIDGFDESWPR